MNKSELSAKLSRIASGAPRGAVIRTHGNYGRDEIGTPYFIQSLAQRETQRRIMKQRGEGRKESFTFNVMENLPYVSSVLTSAQCGYLLVLSTYITYDGLIVNNERDDTPMSQARMLKTLQLRESQRSTLTDFLSVCVDYGIMRRESDGYYISEGFHTKGSPASDRVVRSYITKLREMASENKPEQLGFIYKLLPYIHKTSNMLCENPNELQPSKVRKLNRKRLAELAGVSPDYVTQLTRRMTYNGKSVFAKITTPTDGTFYMLNPAIFRRADRIDYDNDTRFIFGID